MVPVQESMPPPPAASSFNPLKIVIPSAIALVVVFAVIFVFTRNSPATDAEHKSTDADAGRGSE